MLAKSLMLGITAEGVEEITQVEFLRENGCDTFQGYYYSRPLDALAMEQYLRHYFNNGPAATASTHH
jgi:EAL domain-containing protein (putative c-di-GMP-specific phosphodiesterase class I)